MSQRVKNSGQLIGRWSIKSIHNHNLDLSFSQFGNVCIRGCFSLLFENIITFGHTPGVGLGQCGREWTSSRWVQFFPVIPMSSSSFLHGENKASISDNWTLGQTFQKSFF